MQIDGKKSIVLFNNGKIGAIPTPVYCRVGSVVTVSSNRKAVILSAALACAVLLCAVLTAGVLYFKTAGYIHITYGDKDGASVELSYNCFRRILGVRPLNVQAVAPLAELAVRHKKIERVYEIVMLSFINSTGVPAQNITVGIAQDDLAQAKEIERGLTLLTEPLSAAAPERFSARFDLYTLELYRDALAKTESEPQVPLPPMMTGGHQTMMHGNMMTPRVTTVKESENLKDDAEVVMRGRITRSLGDKQYLFQDNTGEIIVEIDRKIWRALSPDINEILELRGEVDREQRRVIIEVKSIRKFEPVTR
jgi:uncharacterized protein (TIGR00156 family)